MTTKKNIGVHSKASPGVKPQGFSDGRKRFLILLLLLSLSGCYAGTVKPFLERPEFKAENEPVRTLKILMLTDGSYRREEIERLLSKCSRILEMQVGMKLEIVDSQEIKWGDERNDSRRMLTKIATETWEKTDYFDVAVAFAYFDERPEPYKLNIGRIDGVFWRYIVVKELEPTSFSTSFSMPFCWGKSMGRNGSCSLQGPHTAANGSG
jgi:hypothetical protein